MKTWCIGRLFIVACVSSLFWLPAAASGAVLGSFDQIFEGDDPSEVFEFNLPFDPAVPTIVRFNGFIENLKSGDDAETGVRFQVVWRPPQGDGAGYIFPDSLEDYLRGVRLPSADPILGPVRVPVTFQADVPYSPALLRFGVEGLGGTDLFRFVGDLSIQPVPEPHAATVGSAVLIATLILRGTRRRAISRSSA
jgi:hypothetical protein